MHLCDVKEGVGSLKIISIFCAKSAYLHTRVCNI